MTAFEAVPLIKPPALRGVSNWLIKQHGIDDYLEMMERWTRATGRRAGREMAEGFCRYTGHPYPQTPLLEELLDGHVVIARAADIPALD